VLDQQPLSFDQTVQIEPGKENLEIRYTGLSFSRPEQLRFKYKLIGLDQDWVDAGMRRTAYYSHVPAGQYVFSVLAAGSDGAWNESGASLRVIVVPPFWKTWWFLSLLLAGAAGMLIVVYKRRVEHLKKAHAAQESFSKQLLDSQERERQRIAAELHDGLGQSLLIIKNRAFLASSANGDHEVTHEQLEEITASASRAIEEVREIAYNLRPYQLDRFGLTKTLHAIFQVLRLHRFFPRDRRSTVSLLRRQRSAYRIVRIIIIVNIPARQATLKIDRELRGHSGIQDAAWLQSLRRDLERSTSKRIRLDRDG
jgi:hypothetical protein